MNRRKFILGLGATAAGGVSLLGSGAFTSVEAERNITVNVTSDSDAFLGLQPSDGPNGEYATESNGLLALTVTETNAGGSGVNPDAETLMDDVLTVTNQGTQEISFLFSGCGMGGWFTSRFGVYVVDGNERISVMTCDANFDNELESDITRRNGLDGQNVLESGDSAAVGVAIKSGGTTSKSRNDLTITAEATGND
jgi:hypothetical protein